METRFCTGCGSRKSIRGVWYLVPDPADGEGDEGGVAPASSEFAAGAGRAPSGPGEQATAAGDGGAHAGAYASASAFMCEQCFHGAASSPYDAQLDPGVWG